MSNINSDHSDHDGDHSNDHLVKDHVYSHCHQSALLYGVPGSCRERVTNRSAIRGIRHVKRHPELLADSQKLREVLLGFIAEELTHEYFRYEVSVIAPSFLEEVDVFHPESEDLIKDFLTSELASAATDLLRKQGLTDAVIAELQHGRPAAARKLVDEHKTLHHKELSFEAAYKQVCRACEYAQRRLGPAHG